MLRVLLVSLVLAAAVAMSALADDGSSTNMASVAASQPRNDTVTIDRQFVRLGDLFPNAAGDKADVAIAYAPTPGSRAVYDVNNLASIARANGIKWQAHSWFDRVVIERPGVTIGDAEVLAVIRTELNKRNVDAKADVELASRGLALQVPTNAANQLQIQNFQLDDRSGQFTGRLLVPGTDEAQAITINGRIYRTVEVPTLSRRIATGDTVGRDDIQWQTVRAETVARNVILEPEKIIGMEAKHPLPDGQPLRVGDVRAPLIVTKGSLVTMVVQSPTMTLTSKGKAMEDGAKGEAVRIQNTQSKIIVEGEVISPGTVRVAGLAPAQF